MIVGIYECMHMNVGMYEVETEDRKRGRYPMGSL